MHAYHIDPVHPPSDPLPFLIGAFPFVCVCHPFCSIAPVTRSMMLVRLFVLVAACFPSCVVHVLSICICECNSISALGNMDHVRLCVRIMNNSAHLRTALCFRSALVLCIRACLEIGIASMHSDEVKEEGPADLHRSIYSMAKNRLCDLHCLHHDGPWGCSAVDQEDWVVIIS